MCFFCVASHQQLGDRKRSSARQIKDDILRRVIIVGGSWDWWMRGGEGTYRCVDAWHVTMSMRGMEHELVNLTSPQVRPIE